MSEVELTREGPVAVLTLNRPEKRNAVNVPMQRGLIEGFRELSRDAALRVLVITGKGGDFCVGGDFTVVEQLEGNDSFELELARLHRGMIGGLFALDIPVIAAVEGAAFGFGAELVAGCDVALMGQSARLADPHVRFDRGPAPVTALLWPRLASRAVAAELLLTGRSVSASEAVAIGLATRVVPDGTALAEAMTVADAIAGLPANGVRETRRALRLDVGELDRFYPQKP